MLRPGGQDSSFPLSPKHQDIMIHFTTSVLKLEVMFLFNFVKSVEDMSNFRKKKKKTCIILHFITLSPEYKGNEFVLSAHFTATGKITAHAMHPLWHYFRYSVNSDFSLIKLDQVCLSASKRTDGNSSLLQGKLRMGTGFLQWSHIRGCCAMFISNMHHLVYG